MESSARIEGPLAGMSLANDDQHAVAEARQGGGIGHGEHGCAIEQDPVKAFGDGSQHLGESIGLQEGQRLFDAFTRRQKPQGQAFDLIERILQGEFVLMPLS